MAGERGFTLLELLVVVVMVGVMALVGFSLARVARGKADEVACMGNMRQIGVAMQLYANDTGAYPETAHTASLENAWIYQLEDYLGDFDETRVCPADPNAAERLAQKGTSYVLNSYVFVPTTDAFGNAVGEAMNRPALLEDMTQTLLAFCCSDEVPAGPGNDHTHSARWTSWSAVTADIAPDRHMGKRSNYLYADGRVESRTAAEVRKKIESGENIAVPVGYES